MDYLLPDDMIEAKPPAADSDRQHGVASPNSFDLQHLPETEGTANACTVADGFDIVKASKSGEPVDAEQTAALKSEMSGCRRDLRTATKQKGKSRQTYHRALGRSHLIATTALQSPGALVALARKRKIPTTKASWKNPMLVVLKMIEPEMDDKSASMCARALNYCSAAGVPPDEVADFLAQHGVVALAHEEAKRQKLRRGGSSEKPPALDPLEALRQDRKPVALSTDHELEGMPEKDGEMGLMLIGRQEGLVVGWAVDADEKAIAATIRRILMRRAGGGSG